MEKDMNKNQDKMKEPTVNRFKGKSLSRLTIVLVILLVVLVLIAGGMYFWSSDSSQDYGVVKGDNPGYVDGEKDEDEQPVVPSIELSESDEVTSILNDVERIDVDSFEDELNQIEEELFNMWVRSNNQDQG